MPNPLLDKVIALIPGYTRAQLLATLRNARNNAKLARDDVTKISASIEKELRDRFPKDADKEFGSLVDAAVVLLQSVADETAAKYPAMLTTNRVGSHVKLGGLKKRGWYYDRYISYRPGEMRASLDIRQQTRSEEPIIRVMLQKVSGKDRATISEQLFSMSDFKMAAAEYVKLVGGLVADAGPNSGQ